MSKSMTHWIKAQWRSKAPATIAQDDDTGGSASMQLREEIASLGARWQKQFDEAAPELARWFSQSMAERSDAQLKAILRRGGFSVRFQMSRAANEAVQATIGENIQLIKSISQQHLLGVQNVVMRGITEGRDLGYVTQQLKERFGVTHRRAAFIARSQANMASATINRVRQQELGVTTAVWVHSGGGRHPRPNHVKAGKEKLHYDVSKGAYIDGAWIYPGQLPNCLTGDTLVDLVNGCHVVWRYYYRGDLIALDTGKATVLATPNHPFLTDKGWVPAETINAGEHVWQARLKELKPAMADENQTKARISDVFAALGVIYGKAYLPGAGFDFHGDIPDTEVEAVRAKRGLLDELYPGAQQRASELVLAQADAVDAISSTAMQVGHAGASGGFGDGLQGFGLGVGEPDQVGLAAVTRAPAAALDPADDQGPGDVEMLGDRQDAVSLVEHAKDLRCREIVEILARYNSAAPKYPINDTYADAEFAGDGSNTGAVGVLLRDDVDVQIDAPARCAAGLRLDRVTPSAEVLAELVRMHTKMGSKVFEAGEFVFEAVRVVKKLRRKNPGTHVYTLQSNYGWYSATAHGLATQNCRCISRSIIPGFD